MTIGSMFNAKKSVRAKAEDEKIQDAGNRQFPHSEDGFY
jgi:hypothetical protein